MDIEKRKRTTKRNKELPIKAKKREKNKGGAISLYSNESEEVNSSFE